MNKVLLFNPKSAIAKHRIPNSIMNIAASVNGDFDWVIVDGNREKDPYARIREHLQTGEFRYVGFTVMPGPQLKQAVPFAKQVKQAFPAITMIWGGYFPTNQYKVVLKSGYFDFVINGRGDHVFPALPCATERKEPYELFPKLI